MRSLALIAGLLSLAAAVELDVVDKLRGVPPEWKVVGKPEPKTRIHFTLNVAHQNEALFEQTLYDISTPSHPSYGKHLKRDELKAMLRPTPEATDAVLNWLKESGVESRDIIEDGEWINYIATVEQAEQMLNTTFNVYRNKARHVDKIRTLQYSVPSDLYEHVEMIQPTTRFVSIRGERNVGAMSTKVYQANAASIAAAQDGVNITACNQAITPACLRGLYNIGDYRPAKKSKAFVGVNGFLEEYARFADLEQFEELYAQYAKGQNFTWTSVNGGVLDQNSTSDSVEANLDIQYTVAMSANLRNNYYSTPGRGPLVPDLDQPTQDDNANEPYLDFFRYLVSLPDKELPVVLSTSYGEDEQSVPPSYAKSVCKLIGQLGARGVSVLFSSGDTGVGSACQTNDGKNTTRFLPIFPAACPYVTSVGGTTGIPEKAIGFSSGGFSDLWKRPKYQDKAVKDYLNILGDQWKGLYNPQGRGFPDISAQSSKFHVIDKGRDILVGGTSASAPAVAGIVALLSDARLQVGKPALGFLNPWLYSEGYKALNDIQEGGSRGCTGKSIYSGLPAPFVPYASWNATKGWDPVTGYGTPDFAKLLKLVKGGY